MTEQKTCDMISWQRGEAALEIFYTQEFHVGTLISKDLKTFHL